MRKVLGDRRIQSFLCTGARDFKVEFDFLG
jgi:hypothetical protein